MGSSCDVGVSCELELRQQTRPSQRYAAPITTMIDLDRAFGQTLPVTTPQEFSPSRDSAELHSIGTVLDDMQLRVVEVADRWRELERDDVAGDLYEVERSLRNAQRRIRRAVQGFER